MRPESLENVPEHAKAGLMAMNADYPMAQPGALDAVLERLEAGDSVSVIAADVGIQELSLYKALLRNAPEQWQAIQSAKSAKKIDNADAELDACADGVQLGRVRERIGLAKWNLERTCRSIYGDKLTVEHQGAPSLTIVIGSVAEPQQSQRNTPELPPIEHQP